MKLRYIRTPSSKCDQGPQTGNEVTGTRRARACYLIDHRPTLGRLWADSGPILGCPCSVRCYAAEEAESQVADTPPTSWQMADRTSYFGTIRTRIESAGPSVPRSYMICDATDGVQGLRARQSRQSRPSRLSHYQLSSPLPLDSNPWLRDCDSIYVPIANNIVRLSANTIYT